MKEEALLLLKKEMHFKEESILIFSLSLSLSLSQNQHIS